MTQIEALEALKRSDKAMLTPGDVAPVLGCQPYYINVQAKQDASALGCPVCRIGTRVRIPRAAFLAWMAGKGAPGA